MKQAGSKRTIGPLEQMRRRNRAAVSVAAPAEAPTAKRKRAAKATVDDAVPAVVSKTVVRKRLSGEDERLLATILSAEQDFIDSPAFYEENAPTKIYDDAPDIQKPDTTWYHPVMDDLSSTSRTRTVKSTQQVILTGAEERVLFHQFNYARYRVWKLQQDVWARPSRLPTPEQADDILRWHRRAERIREQIAETNLALVLAMAKRTRMSEVDFADLVSEGNMACSAPSTSSTRGVATSSAPTHAEQS